ncbi:multiple epidermal growth factor-like domains protein 6 [Haliotis asinina]|uniref:multiple epidermal growth factor-like domains protein 6 n=1 Tax=Haliotis asinina TaxID=109174 RepID=UPI003531C6FE
MMEIWCLVFVLCCGILVQIEGRCNCKFNCDTNPAGQCRDGLCQPGWYGPYCQKRNVAWQGKASQQGTRTETSRLTQGRRVVFSAVKAIDGNTNVNLYKRPYCAQTGLHNNTWWKVKLKKNGLNQIRYMTVFFPEDSDHRKTNVEILVGGKRCKKWESWSRPPSVAEVACSESLTGDEVMLRIPDNSLSVCEVQVFVCSDFWYGKNCDRRCNCLDKREICDKGTGECYRKDCPPGFIGYDCYQVCEDGWYGQRCKSKCGNCQDGAACHKETGNCTQGCAPGYSTRTCDVVDEDVSLAPGVQSVTSTVVASILMSAIVHRSLY